MRRCLPAALLAAAVAVWLIDWSWLAILAGPRTLNSAYMQSGHIGAFINLYLRSLLFALLASATVGLWLHGPKIKRPMFWAVVLMALVYTALMAWLTYHRYLAFHSYHDMTANLEAVWNIFKTGLPYSTAEGSLYELPFMNWFGIHFTPIIYLFALLAFPFRFPESVFVWQALLLGSGAVAVYLLAKDALEDEFSALAFAAAYLLYPTLQYTNIYEFEFFRFVTPLLLWAFYFINKKDLWLTLLFLALALLTREDTAPVILVLGLYLFFARKEKRLGTIVASVALVYGFAAQLIFRPFFSQGTDFVIKNVYAAFGQTPFQVLVYFLSHPLTALGLMLSPLKIMNIALLLLPLGFLSLGAPGLLLVALSGMLIPLLAPGIAQANIFLHKFAAAIPFLFIAAIYGQKWLVARGRTFNWPVYLLVAALLSGFFFGPSPLSRQFWDRSYRLADFRTHNFHYTNYLVTAHDAVAYQALAIIPQSAVVSAEHFFLPHLFDRKKLYTFPVVGRDVEYVLIDRRHPSKKPEFNPGSKSSSLAEKFRADPAAVYAKLERDRNFTRIFKRDGIELFRREE